MAMQCRTQTDTPDNTSRPAVVPEAGKLKKSADYTQPELIQVSPIPVVSTKLVAPDSAKIAYYIVEVFQLPGSGFRVQKASGASGAKPILENYWRPTLAMALEKRDGLVRSKMNKERKGRVYAALSVPVQVELDLEVDEKEKEP